MWVTVSVALGIVAASLTAALIVVLRRRPRVVEQTPGAGSESIDISAEILAAAFDEIATSTVIADAEGQIVLRNRAAEPYRGGRHGEALVEASVQERLRQARLGHRTEEDLRLHGPPERVVQVRGHPMMVDGKSVGSIALVEDLTEQRRLEAMRRDFIANVSHELKTPVGALSLLAETLEDETDPEVIGRFSNRIRHEATRLADLIDGLLDLSRIEGGEHDREPVAVAAVVAEALASVAPLASAAQVEVVAPGPGFETEATVVGDRGQLVGAVVNLLDNAVKYTPPGGHVAVELARAEGELLVTVADTGEGIPKRDLHRVFERFYRVDRGRSSNTGGTGLGLAIVRNVAANHGGRVELESREGEGSRFTLVLPLGGRSDSGGGS